MNKVLKCARCSKPFYNCKWLHPIDPKGTKNRRWVCSDCETNQEYKSVDANIKRIENDISRGATE